MIPAWAHPCVRTGFINDDIAKKLHMEVRRHNQYRFTKARHNTFGGTMNTQPNSGYHPTHLLFALIVTLSSGAALFQERPWGWPLAIAGGLAVLLAMLTSRPPLDPGCWTALALTVLTVATPLITDNQILQVVIWALAAIGTGFFTMNLMYGAPSIPDRGLTAFLSIAGVFAAGALVNMSRDAFPWVWWVTWMMGGPIAGAIFGKFARAAL